MRTQFRSRLVLPALAPLLAVAAAAVYLACEKEVQDEVDKYFKEHPYASGQDRSAEEGVEGLRMLPATAAVTFIGEEIHFRVEGGDEPFRWDVADDDHGEVTENGERDAVYKAKTLDPNSVIAVDDEGRTAVGRVGFTTAALSVTPATLTVAANPGDTYNFIAAGGSAPYSWHTVIGTLGAIVGNGGDNETATYTVTSGNAGTNTVVLVDQAGATAQASVIHQ
jgi:hypothetical protein